MTYLELTEEDAGLRRGVLEARWQELMKEVRHTDHREFRERLKRETAGIERLLSRLEPRESQTL